MRKREKEKGEREGGREKGRGKGREGKREGGRQRRSDKGGGRVLQETQCCSMTCV